MDLKVRKKHSEFYYFKTYLASGASGLVTRCLDQLCLCLWSTSLLHGARANNIVLIDSGPLLSLHLIANLNFYH